MKGPSGRGRGEGLDAGFLDGGAGALLGARNQSAAGIFWSNRSGGGPRGRDGPGE
jgi:hypothetical protein